jgi:hypothetical protein
MPTGQGGHDGPMAGTRLPEVDVRRSAIQGAITARAFVVDDGLDSIRPQFSYRFCDRLEGYAALHTARGMDKGDEKADAECHSRHSEDNETAEHD